jgi:Chaperone of endosialidase
MLVEGLGWFARLPRVGSVCAGGRVLLTTLTIALGGSVQNAHAQKVEETPTSPPIAGFELPEGTRQDSRNPGTAFNPQTGQNLIRDGRSQKWIDTKTGQVVGPVRTVFFGPPKGAKWDGNNYNKAVNPQSGQKFVWDAGIQKWIDIKTDRAFNPAYIDQEGKVVRKFAVLAAPAGRAPPVVEPAVHPGAQVESGRNGSFAENFGYYFNGIAQGASGSIQFYTGRDAFRYVLAGELAGTTKFPELGDWIKSLLAPVGARSATAQSGSSWQVTPVLSANLSMGDVYQSWWTAPDGKLVSGFLAGTTVGLRLAPDFPIAEKWHWLGYTATGSLTFSFSDRRLKRDIIELSRLGNGIGLYRYRYSWSDQLYVGVMAQEVAEIVPDAVLRGADGYLRVDYVRLGLKLQTWDEWTASRTPHPDKRAEEQPRGDVRASDGELTCCAYGLLGCSAGGAGPMTWIPLTIAVLSSVARN